MTKQNKWPGPACIPTTVKDEIYVGDYIRRVKEVLGPRYEYWARTHSKIGTAQCRRLLEIEAWHQYFGSPTLRPEAVRGPKPGGSQKQSTRQALRRSTLIPF